MRKLLFNYSSYYILKFENFRVLQSPSTCQRLAIYTGVMREKHGHNQVNQLLGHSHPPLACNSTDHPDVLNQGRPVIEAECLIFR
jgi:hypothetical protein